MNADFHYHATHLAARIAGFNKAEADTIGYAAAFVDELSASAKPAKSPDRVTVMTTAELLKMPFSSPFKWSTADKRNFFEVWQCFHFLPGNEFYHKRYDGSRSYSATQSWSYSMEV